MKRAMLILALGFATAALAYAVVFFDMTSREREAMKSDAPELWWLKQEFHLDDAQFQRVSLLHQGYLPQCGETCRKIAEKKAALKDIFSRTNAVTPEVEKKLQEISQLQAECQAGMLRHFYQVSQAMPPEQGRRYLAWVQEKTILAGVGQMDMGNPGHKMP
jgi:hypothetical protein